MFAKFFLLEWEISSDISKMFDGWDTELSVKTETDGNTNLQILRGCDLRTLSLPYTVVKCAGADVVKEIKTIKSMLGITSPIYINGKKLLSTLFMLTDAQCSNFNLTPKGDIVSCEITLFFTEIRLSLGIGGLRVYYNDIDITNFISIVECEHIMNADSAPDEITVKFADNNFLWDKWSPKNGDGIRVTDGLADTGKMFIQSVSPENGYMTLMASSVPEKMYKVLKDNNKSWSDVYFLQIMTEIASRNGLTIETQDVENRVIKYVQQENMSDLQFMQERCELEGYSFVVFNEKIVIYSPDSIDKTEPEKTITIKDDDNFIYEDNTINAYGAYEVDNGTILGTASVDNESENRGRKIFEGYIESQAEGNMYAKNLLVKENRGLKTGMFTSDIMRDLSAASVAILETPMASSTDGAIFYTKIRNDYVNKKTEHNFRFI